MTENEAIPLEVTDEKCQFRYKFTGKVCGAPLIYDSKYDVYKCSVYNHYVISREEYERRRKENEAEGSSPEAQ